MPQAVNAWDSLPDYAPPAPVSSPDSSVGAPSSPDVTVDPSGHLTITVRPQSAYKNAWDALPDYQPPAPKAPTRDIGTAEAAGRGAIDAATFGLTPTLAGLNEAGNAGKSPQQLEEETALRAMPQEAPGLQSIGEGLARLFGDHPDPEARAAFERGRQSVLDDQRLAQEQHPGAFLAGQFVGGALTPGFGATSAGTLPARLITGTVAGGIGAGLYGAGEAISEGKSAPEVLESAGKSAAIGAPTGGILKGAIGPRVTNAVLTSGERAAATAADLGAPLPRGVTSDNPALQNLTAKATEVPFAGAKINQAVKRTDEAAGNRIGDIADTMAQGARGRSVADTFIRPALQDVVDANKQAADTAYNAVRSQIDQNAKFTMPRTDATLNRIMADRQAAGWPNPAEGLEQFRNIAGGATFNGAHRARVDARNAGNMLNPHPGYNAADYNRLTGAMTADLREIVQHAAKGKNPQSAVQAFNEAEMQFGRIAEQNKILSKLVNAGREGAVGALLNAANEKSGNLKLLAQLRQQMKPDEFSLIGGTLLHELGWDAKTKEFSLAKFVTNWNKLSDGAKRVLFDPAHLRNINDIVGMGTHIKRALETANRSHTGGTLIAWDALKTAAEGAIAAGAGAIGPHQFALSIGTFATANLLTRWLASPAKAASIAAWSRNMRAIQQNPTPGRMATFKIATRNLANTLGIDSGAFTQRIEAQLQGLFPGKAEEKSSNQQK